MQLILIHFDCNFSLSLLMLNFIIPKNKANNNINGFHIPLSHTLIISLKFILKPAPNSTGTPIRGRREYFINADVETLNDYIT